MIRAELARFGLALALALAVGSAFAQAAPAAAPPAAAAAGKPVRETDEAAFKRIDKNADNMIGLEEFKAELQLRRRAALFNRLQRQFQAMDKNHNGSLESAEFYELPIIKTPGKKPAPTFGEVDGNRDAKIDFKEYLAMLARVTASK